MISKYLLDSQWKKLLKTSFEKDSFKNLENFLNTEYRNEIVFPPRDKIFEAFNKTSFEDVKAIIIGQDPYHGDGQAHGLCFSVLAPTKPPPSLKNIFSELCTDMDISQPQTGNLSSWAESGVLLLNSILTVRKGLPMSHKKRGWEDFTSAVIEILNEEKEHLVFIAWGAAAHEKVKNIDLSKHLVLKSVHPSPLSVYRGFIGCKHFSKTNDFLKKKKLGIINWKIS